MVPDKNRAMAQRIAQRELEDLSSDECYRLLATANVGRLVYQDELGPLAVPVNYAMQGTTSSSASKVARNEPP
jgi:nitroimidazol reductase NimA-like FMN-containing flavoprotein (pyridoxamine 5'-phosphate oxidase superfamily)